MKKQRKVNRCSAKATAVILVAAMVVQTTTPALALAQLGEGADARSAVSTASQSNAAKGDEHSDTAPSRASGSNAEKLEKATFSNAMRKEVKNLHPNGSFEFTGKTTNTNYQKVWVNEIMPIGWSMWPTPTGSEKMSFEIVTDPEEAADGDNYLHIRSENTASRLGISYPIKNIADLADQYLCTFQLKAEDVKGTGFNGRLTWLKKSGSGNYIETAKITGTSDGWVQYGLISPDQPADATGIQVEFYANNLSGEISLDDVQILPTYKLSLNKTETTMLTGDTLELTATCSDGYDEEVTWSSKDPAIADVDENGVVTAYAMGMVEIVAKTDTFHEAICKISIEDGELRPYYEAIRDSWRDRLTGNSMEDTDDEDYKAMMADLTETAKKNWDTMEKGGNDRAFLWDDIDFTYQKQNTASNVTEGLGTGFSRIEQMATAYSAKGSSLYHDEDLKADIIGAMEWVYATMYNDTMDVTKDIYGNWWHWFIGMPQSLCNTVILMYDDLDPEFIEREAKTLENFNEDPNYRYHTTGGNRLPLDSANLIDTSLVSALRASIGETALPLNMAKDALEKNLGFTSEGNGYYEDGSYIDHGNLAYTGGYGATLLGGIEKLLFITSDSPWEADSDKLTSIFQWIWNGIRPLYADGAMMDMTTGRGIARPSTNEHTVGKGLLKPISHLAAIAPEDERDVFRTFARTEVLAGLEYEEDFFIGMTVADMTAMKNLITDNSLGKDDEIYHKNFGAMDKAVYHGENFDLGISMYSKRTGSFEYGNKENRKGWHMSDGALYLYNGDQAHYADVYWPTVDPHRLAGITTDHTEGFIPSDDSWGPHVSTKNWVGGSSVLDQYGSVGMDFEGELPNGGISSLKAKKSWFTFPNGAAALGAGITSNENKATETIVDNRKAMEDAANTVWVNGTEAELTVGNPAVMPAKWALLEGNNGEQQNIGYYFPEETEITVLKETRTGNWKDINGAIVAGSANDKEIIRSYISLAVDHGTNPQDETYSYVLLPGKNADEMAEFAENPEIKVLANTSSVQAVENTAYGVSGYNFWTAYDGEELEVSAKTPASVTIAKEDGTVTAGISNPTQNGKDTVILLNGFYEPAEMDKGVTVTTEDGRTVITIKGASDLGKTYTVVLESMDKKLADWQNKLQNITREDAADVEVMIKELQNLDTENLNEEQKSLIDSLLETAGSKLILINSVNEVMAPISRVDEVTFENADAVEEYLKKYGELTEAEKAVASEADKAKIAALTAGFQTENVHTAAEGVTVKAVYGTVDVRTMLLLHDESAAADFYQETISEGETLLHVFKPALLLKDSILSLNDYPVNITMKAPALASGEQGILKLYSFTSAGKARAAISASELSFTDNRNGTITFEAKYDGIYGFALAKDTEPAPDPEPVPDKKPSGSSGNSSESVSDGVWVQDANGWWFNHYNGTWPAAQWKWIKGSWYHFNEAGYMQTGWILDKGFWYYLRPDGSMVADDWVFYKDHWYYLTRNGEMATNTSVTWKGIVYHLGADGVMAE